MQLKHLQYLVGLAKQRHFGRAANTLHISQSALSQAIQHLEKHFSTPIVLRDQSGFQGFTREGEAILSWARQSLADHDRLLNSSQDENEADLKGSLRLALSPVAMTITSLLTAPFAERYPGITISVQCKTMPEIERGLKEFVRKAMAHCDPQCPLSALSGVDIQRWKYP